MEKIIETFEKCMNNEKYETNGFMRPEIVVASEIIEYIPDEEKEIFDGAKCALRLSAQGYLDCTDWTPISNCRDVYQFFNTFCLED